MGASLVMGIRGFIEIMYVVTYIGIRGIDFTSNTYHTCIGFTSNGTTNLYLGVT